MISGHFTLQAQERIVFGKPAEIAVVEEVERCGAKRVFVVSTRSLAGRDNGPLQRIERALGERHVGTFSAIAAHSPREDVIAAAAHARAARADLLVALGGGSVVDAAKAIQLCLWFELETPEAMGLYLARKGATGKEPTLPSDPVRMISVTTTLS